MLFNCSQAVRKGINRGELTDGTAVYLLAGSVIDNFPKNKMKKLEKIFYNNAFTYEEYDKQLNNRQ